MSKADILRGIIAERLRTAAQEILAVVERTVAAYEEEASGLRLEIDRQERRMDDLLQPRVRLETIDIQLLLVSKDEVPTEQQEWRPSLDQDDPPELPHIKEEQEEHYISREGQELKEADVTKYTLSPVPVKSEEDDDDEPQFSQLHHTEEMKTEADGENCRGPEPDRNFYPDCHLQPHTEDGTSHSSESETDDSGDWEETSEPQSGLNPLRNNEETKCKSGKSSSECSTSFAHKRHLQEHSGTQTKVKVFSCSVCGKIYKRKRSLTAHKRVHSEGKSLECSVCKKTFPLRGDFVMHMRIHTGEKPFSSSVCGARFVQPQLGKRRRIHTRDKPFSCSVCGARFARKEHLQQHMRTHTGEKPFSCSVCGKGFALSGNLRQHIRIHTGEKPFSCSVCYKRFTRFAYLKQHKCVVESCGCK